MHLKCRIRRKDGKLHRSYSIVESRRRGRRVFHKHVLYLGEITDAQRRSWQDAIEVFDETQTRGRGSNAAGQIGDKTTGATPAAHKESRGVPRADVGPIFFRNSLKLNPSPPRKRPSCRSRVKRDIAKIAHRSVKAHCHV